MAAIGTGSSGSPKGYEWTRWDRFCDGVRELTMVFAYSVMVGLSTAVVGAIVLGAVWMVSNAV